MTRIDVVAVLPGIMGSTLARDGKLVWSPSAGSIVRAIGTFGRSVTALQLPDGVGDEHPGDGVEPVALMPDVHALPGLWTPVKGYDPLLERLRVTGFTEQEGNLVLVPYDWRLSNRYNGQRLKTIVEPPLERRRARGGDYQDAQLILVCHSMGGLVARWYLERCGGAEVTRKLITLGTPYRGAAKALAQLVNREPRGLGPLSIDLTGFIRSMPSIYQLLPSYACVSGPGALQTLAEAPPPELPTEMVRDAAAFHDTLDAAEAARPASAEIRHAILGVRQLTPTTARYLGSTVELIDEYEARNLFGDATVPTVAVPKGIPLDANTLRRVADKHGNLQRNAAALDEVESIVTAEPIVVRAGEEFGPRVDVADFWPAGQPLDAEITIPDDPALAVAITLKDEAGAVVEARTPRPAGGVSRATFDALTPGAYSLDVTGRGAGSPVSPVSSDILIWSDSVLV